MGERTFRILGIFLLAVSLMPLDAFSNNLEAQDGLQVEEMTEIESGDIDGINEHSSWRFLGCVHNEDHHHECEHLAEDRGYYDSRPLYDHHRCTDHHHSYACWGR